MFKILFDRDTWQEIFGSIQKNRLRTIVTIVGVLWGIFIYITLSGAAKGLDNGFDRQFENVAMNSMFLWAQNTSIPYGCLLYTSPSPRDDGVSRMPSSA